MDSRKLTAEADEIKARYRRRTGAVADRYSFARADVLLAWQERERALVRCLSRAAAPPDTAPLAQRTLLEVGCGAGGNLLHLILLGFAPENLAGIDLIDDRIAHARRILPPNVEVVCGDACTVSLPSGRAAFDIVMQSTAFSSILDLDVQTALAARMWQLLKPGGAVLWYDFVYDNPWNADVRGVPMSRIRQLFPEGRMTSWRLTLAPPLARRLVAVHPSLYGLFNALPLLRTHRLCWIEKP